MDRTLVNRILGVGRIANGASILALPALYGGAWVGRDGTREGAQVLLRSAGARDAVLGIGIAGAAGDPRAARRWLALTAVCDVADFAATAVAKDIPRNARLVGFAAAGGAALIYAVAALTVKTGDSGAEEPLPHTPAGDPQPIRTPA